MNYCLQSKLKEQVREVVEYQPIDILVDEEQKLKCSIDEIEVIIREVNHNKEIPQPYDVKFIGEDSQQRELERIKSSSGKLNLSQRNKKVELEGKLEYLNQERKLNKNIINTFLKLVNYNYSYTLSEQATIFKNMLDHDFFQNGYTGGVRLKIHHEGKNELSFNVYLTKSEWSLLDADIKSNIALGFKNYVEVRKIPRKILIERVLPKYIRYCSRNIKDEDEIGFVTGSWYVYEDF